MKFNKLLHKFNCRLHSKKSNQMALSPQKRDIAMHERVCIEKYWMETTRFLRYIHIIDKCFERSPSLRALCENKESSKKVISCLATHSKHHEAQRVLTRLWNIGDNRSQKQYIIAAYLQILKYDTFDGIWALVERIVDRIDRCQSAQRQAFTLLIQYGAHVYEFPCDSNIGNCFKFDSDRIDDLIPSIQEKGSRIIHTHNIFSLANNKIMELDKDARAAFQTALQNIHFMVEDFLDTHKENAFKSALHEPARFYFHLCGNTHHRDHVNVHGLNGFLCLIRGWFGCQLPLSPLSTDEDTFKGCADIWSGLSDKAWEVFQEEANFGKDFEGLKGLNSNMLTDNIHGSHHAGHGFVGRNAACMETAARNKDPRYLKYANKFAYFFRKEFLMKKMLEVLNAEGKPEYTGFGKACEVLFPLFKKEHDLIEDTFLESMYDENFMHLDVDRAAQFFWFCGICKRSESQMNPPIKDLSNDSSDLTCPICFEEKTDVKQIPHWNPKGDISSHKMCGDCTRQYDKNDCPFCHDISLKDNILSSIQDFIGEVKNRKSRRDPNQLAALFEMWQFFEMEYANNPKVIQRVAKHVVQDSAFNELLQSGINMKSDWMRDAAGTIFRLYSLSMDGLLDINDNEKQILTSSYETIIYIARKGNADSGHYYGALYSQAMAPYICALQSGQSTRQLEVIIREVGNMIVHLYKRERNTNYALKREIPERIIAEYMPYVTENVWGGKSSDPVWNEFFT